MGPFGSLYLQSIYAVTTVLLSMTTLGMRCFIVTGPMGACLLVCSWS